MRVVLASDHAGFALKGDLAAWLKTEGHEVEDMGPHELDPNDDYPTYIMPLAEKVAQDKDLLGIVIGHSGQGEAIAANRVPGARAAVFYGGPDEIVTLSRQHNGANILSLGAHFVDTEAAKRAVDLWLSTPFSGEERHVRRIAQLDRL